MWGWRNWKTTVRVCLWKHQRFREADLNTFAESTVSSPIIPKCLRLTWRPLNLCVFPVKWFGYVIVDDPKGGIQQTLQQSKSCCWRLFSGLKIDKTIHHWRRDCGESTWRWQCSSSTCRFPKKLLSLWTPAWVLPTRKVPSTMLISNRWVACSNDWPNKVAKNNAALSCMEMYFHIYIYISCSLLLDPSAILCKKLLQTNDDCRFRDRRELDVCLERIGQTKIRRIRQFRHVGTDSHDCEFCFCCFLVISKCPAGLISFRSTHRWASQETLMTLQTFRFGFFRSSPTTHSPHALCSMPMRLSWASTHKGIPLLIVHFYMPSLRSRPVFK